MERDPIEVLGERVENGIKWLTDNDPDGAFHFWFKAGLLPTTPMPAQTEERIERWKRYYNNRRTWEQLFSRLDRLEKERARGQEAATV